MKHKKLSHSQKRKMTGREALFMTLFFFALIPFGIALMISTNYKDRDLNFDQTVRGIVDSKSEIRRQNKKRDYYIADFVSYSIAETGKSYSIVSNDVTTNKVGDSVNVIYASSEPGKGILESEKISITNSDVSFFSKLIYPLGALAAFFLILGLREGFKKKPLEEPSSN